MSDDYSLTVVNDSEMNKPTFALFAVLPSDNTYAALHTAWLTEVIHSGTHFTFTWPITWGLAFQAGGVKPGYAWKATKKLAEADPSSPSRCAALLTYDTAFNITYRQNHPVAPNKDTLYITDDKSVPRPSVQPSSVGVTLAGNPICAIDAGPNLDQTFTLHPTYYISAGIYVPGQMVDSVTGTDFYELIFEDGNQNLTATLSPDNVWTSEPTASVNFAQRFAA